MLNSQPACSDAREAPCASFEVPLKEANTAHIFHKSPSWESQEHLKNPVTFDGGKQQHSGSFQPNHVRNRMEADESYKERAYRDVGTRVFSCWVRGNG